MAEAVLPYAELHARQGLGLNHRLLVEAVPEGARVLDVGCASGYVAEALAARGASTVGIEPDPDMARAATEHCEAVFTATVEEARDLPELAARSFDVVIFGDVLEHLADPPAALEWARGMLAPGGRVLVSIPNVAHWSVRWSLLRGRFEYEDHGLLDRTHLRFFTHATAHELVEQAGFRVVDERYTPAPLPGEETVKRLRRAPTPAAQMAEAPEGPRRLPRWASRATVARLMPGLFAMQFVMTLVPRDQP